MTPTTAAPPAHAYLWLEFDGRGWTWQLTRDSQGEHILAQSSYHLTRWEDADTIARAKARQLGIREVT